MAKNYKYSAYVGEPFNYNRGTGTVYADTITETRKKVYKKVKAANWHKSGSNPIGYLYEYAMRNDPDGRNWGVDHTVAHLEYDKREGVLWWSPYIWGRLSEKRVVKADGTLGMTQTAYRRF